jgi:hypothetical protein
MEGDEKENTTSIRHRCVASEMKRLREDVLKTWLGERCTADTRGEQKQRP